jgi:hypothetical protein
MVAGITSRTTDVLLLLLIAVAMLWLISTNLKSVPFDFVPSISSSPSSSGISAIPSKETTFESEGDSTSKAPNFPSVWLDPLHPGHGDVVSSRFAWTWRSRLHMSINPLKYHTNISKLCLPKNETMCLDEAFISSPMTMPACMLEHLHIRSTFIHNNNSVSIVEISKHLAAAKERVIFCPANSNPANVTFFGLTRWLTGAMPKLTHFGAFISCPATNEADPNASGIVLINYYSNCSLPKSPPKVDFRNPRGLPQKTTAIFIPTPITRSFMQEYPNEPRRAHLFFPPNLPVISTNSKENVNLSTTPNHLNNTSITTIPYQNMPFQYSICAMAATVDTNAPFLTHWLWHLKHRVMVEHVTIYTSPDNFYFDSPHINASFIFELIETGWLQLIPWAPRFVDGTQIFYRSQLSAYNDYIYRFRGMCHWNMFADVDDFFVSWKTNHSIVPFLQNLLSSKPETISVIFGWPTFFPECQNITGLKPPYESDTFLGSIKYGTIKSSNTKAITVTVEKDEVGIHGLSPSKIAIRTLSPGVAMYHIRAGNLAKRGIPDYSPETCGKFLLDFGLEKLSNYSYK